jgi:membrane associated rhomboid family serine protease
MNNLPPVVKNLIIINVIIWIATELIGDNMFAMFALFPIESPLFKWHQLVTHMFMHGGFWHIFFNMYTLMIFGSVLERMWGAKKFIIYYAVTGIGAALLHTLVNHIQISHLEVAGNVAQALSYMRTPTVGASGAIYGLLLGYAMLFPDNIMQLVFPPIALKAKWFVLIFAAIELVTGITGMGGNIAHFAHLGGMLFGYLLILYWKRKGRLYY